jgi:catechol 2,3-dioxygenase-like lactoylglutathione lyase family enzyme
MLASMKMAGFLLTKDYDKARAFYEGNLGFEFVSLDQFALVMQAGKSAAKHRAWLAGRRRRSDG